MRNLRYLFAAVFSLLAVLGRAEPDGAARFDAAGCRACHRVGLYGGDAGPDLTLVGFRRPRAWIDAWLASPHAWKADTRMPEQGLSAADRAALADFLSAQKGQAWGAGRPWRGERGIDGRLVYARAGCIACHGTAGRGGHPNPGAPGDVIPALAPLMATYKPQELKNRIRQGAVSEGKVSMPAWDGVLSEPELDALTDYLFSLAAIQPKSDW